jgi:site-specific DNA recombinase
MELSQKMLAGLVQRIDIFEKKRVRITLKFQDGYHVLTDHLTERAHSREKVAG